MSDSLYKVTLLCKNDCVSDGKKFLKEVLYYYYRTGYSERIWYSIYGEDNKLVNSVVIDFMEDNFFPVEELDEVDKLFNSYLDGEVCMS